MIRPTNRLLCWVVLALPFAALGPIDPNAGMASMAAFGILFGLAVFDAAGAIALAQRVRVVMPEIVRMSRGKAGAIQLRIDNLDGEDRNIVVGLPLPTSIRSEHDELSVHLPAGVKDSVVTWECTPDARGCFVVRQCYHAVTSALGFWNARGVTGCKTEIRVYPNLLSEKQRLAALFLHRGEFGLHRQRMIGHGREFEKLREYVPGDSYDEIHWKATAKRGRPVTKLFQVERTQEVYVAIDTSRLSARTAGVDPVLEKFVTAALVLGLAAEQQNDLFGLLTFGSRVNRFIRASGGRSHFNMCRDAIFSVKPELASPDFDELCAFVRMRMRRRSLLIVLTDLSDPMLADSFQRNVELICRTHVVVVAMINQPGVGCLFNEPDVESVDHIYRKLGGHMVWHGLREIGKKLGNRGVAFSTVSEEKLSAEIVNRYLGIKARQVV